LCRSFYMGRDNRLELTPIRPCGRKLPVAVYGILAWPNERFVSLETNLAE
jgi:hypothetical protein